MQEILVVIISAAVGAVVAYAGAVWQTRLEARRFIHERVHENRVRLYPEAWKLTGVLPLRPRDESLTYESLSALAMSLRDWYYAEGGMYLSGGARRAYSTCQDTLEDTRKSGASNTELSEGDYERARKACSTFRSWLTRDLLSRSRAPMGKKWKAGPT